MTRAEFDLFLWQPYPPRRKRGHDAAFRHASAQIKTRSDFAAAQTAIANYKKEIEILELDDKFVMLGSTFFNGRWKDYVDGVWVAPRPKKRGPSMDEIMGFPS